MYKIRLQRYFLKLATNGQSDKAFLLTSGFCPQREKNSDPKGLSALPRGYIHVKKTLQNKKCV